MRKPDDQLSPGTRYRRIKVGGRMVQEHRHIVALTIGRELTKDEYVHHKNGNKLDNRPDNLEIINPRDHAEHHLRKHPDTNVCTVCGVVFVPPKTKRGGRKKTCSRGCFLKTVRADYRCKLRLQLSDLCGD